jgi:hypothetical protein
MNFTDDQQQKHRDAYIEETRQKAWGAACHADWIAQGLDHAMVVYTDLKKRSDENLEEQKRLKDGLDSHTDENQAKRKQLRDEREAVEQKIAEITKNIQQGQLLLQQLYQSVETNLELAEHCKTWSWKEADPKKDDIAA